MSHRCFIPHDLSLLLGVHVFGLCATALVTDVIQLATGYHTPFFLTVCKPNYTVPGVSCDKNPYITKDICSGQDQHAILSARKTFPSQHATLSSFAAVYISMYFNSTISDSTKLLKPVLVFAFAIAAALTGLTQITQYRSHPIDVYVGFCIGAGIAAYLAFHAVANFKSPEDTVIPQPPPLQKDALRALAQRGHDSVYNKGHASESNEEITSPACLDGLNRPVQREKTSLGSLKRASVDVELLAPRSPMGKETMVTFSNTLPRATAPEEPTRRLVTVPVPVPLDPMRSHQLVSEWKQKSMVMRGGSLPDEDTSDQGSDGGNDTTTEEDSTHSSVYSSVQPSAKPANPPAGARVVMPPRPPAQPSVPPPVSPKSASTRAKWLSITEKSGANIPVLKAGNQPRIMQVIAMSKQQGLLSGSAKSSETSSSSGTSSITGTESSPNRSERDNGSGIITVDAHAPHHPVVRMTSNPNNPWEWRGSSDGNMAESYELKNLNRDGSRSYRNVRSSSPCSSTSEADHGPPQPPQPPQPPLPPQLPPVGHTSEGRSLRRKTPLVLLDREGNLNHTEQDNYYKKLQSGRHFKE
uniref:Phospholipid phosphatase-related protein type 3 n=1 Tax=Sinocyclocheilus rhinocerous TaxID=307959 RepID=A0A673J9L0_9TELE